MIAEMEQLDPSLMLTKKQQKVEREREGERKREREREREKQPPTHVL